MSYLDHTTHQPSTVLKPHISFAISPLARARQNRKVNYKMGHKWLQGNANKLSQDASTHWSNFYAGTLSPDSSSDKIDEKSASTESTAQTLEITNQIRQHHETQKHKIHNRYPAFFQTSSRATANRVLLRHRYRISANNLVIADQIQNPSHRRGASRL
jgi:hypothetical protein